MLDMSTCGNILPEEGQARRIGKLCLECTLVGDSHLTPGQLSPRYLTPNIFCLFCLSPVLAPK